MVESNVNKPKSQRVKNALSKFKTLLLKKEVTIDDTNPLTLFDRQTHEDHIALEVLPAEENQESCMLKMVRSQKVITLESFKETLTEKVDNTGNVRDWPSEDILAYYAIKKALINDDLNQAEQLRILELGAGKTGLIGFALAAIAKSRGKSNLISVITDGNNKCVESLQKTWDLNPEI